MSKRLTETEKWTDPWFRRLRSEWKLAWLYLLDNCDMAGVVDLDEELAEFQIGDAVDFQGFVAASDGRVAVLPSGKLHITRFVEFQYGKVDPESKSNVIQSVWRTLQKHNLEATLQEPYRNPSGRVKDKEKVKDKVKDKNKEIELPTILDSPEFRSVLESWLDYHEPYKPRGLQSLISSAAKRAEQHGLASVVNALEIAMSNGWKGWNFDGSFQPTRGKSTEVIPI